MQQGEENQSSTMSNVSNCKVTEEIRSVKRVVKQVVATRDTGGSDIKLQTRVGIEFNPGLHVEFDQKSLKSFHDELDKIQEHLDRIHSNK